MPPVSVAPRSIQHFRLQQRSRSLQLVVSSRSWSAAQWWSAHAHLLTATAVAAARRAAAEHVGRLAPGDRNRWYTFFSIVHIYGFTYRIFADENLVWWRLAFDLNNLKHDQSSKLLSILPNVIVTFGIRGPTFGIIWRVMGDFRIICCCCLFEFETVATAWSWIISLKKIFNINCSVLLHVLAKYNKLTRLGD